VSKIPRYYLQQWFILFIDLFIYGWQKISFFRPEKYDFDAHKEGLVLKFKTIFSIIHQILKRKNSESPDLYNRVPAGSQKYKKKFLAHLVYSQIWLNPIVYNHQFGNITKLKEKKKP
jgi:hypothetical protein